MRTTVTLDEQLFKAASAALAADARLWSRDKRLVGVASEMGLAYQVASGKGN